MAFFSKPPAKKIETTRVPEQRTGAAPRSPSARELAVQAGRKGPTQRPAAEPAGVATITGASLIDWNQNQSSIEVTEANPGLCAVLENAALLFASGQAGEARKLLDEGVHFDHDAKLSPLAWLALFDLLKRAKDRAAFDQLALQYVVQFERSAPTWEELGGEADTAAKPALAGYVAVAGHLTASSGAQLEGLKRAIEKRVPNARLDLASVHSFDDDGARMLAALLAEARKRKLALSLERPQALRTAVDAAVRKGREGGEGAWMLCLEMMQWQSELAGFDDRALEFAVAFEVSPPSWEPPPLPAGGAAPPPADDATTGDAAAVVQDAEAIAWTGVMAGPSTPKMNQIYDIASRRPIVTLDLTAAERVDFVCAGSLSNVITRIESQRKGVQIVGATPIIRALLLLIGVSPRHFVRKSA